MPIEQDLHWLITFFPVMIHLFETIINIITGNNANSFGPNLLWECLKWEISNKPTILDVNFLMLLLKIPLLLKYKIVCVYFIAKSLNLTSLIYHITKAVLFYCWILGSNNCCFRVESTLTWPWSLHISIKNLFPKIGLGWAITVLVDKFTITSKLCNENHLQRILVAVSLHTL